MTQPEYDPEIDNPADMPDGVIDDDEHVDPDQEDIGTDDPFADGGEEEVPDTEIDDLPEVGEPDPNEAPVLDG